MRLECCRKSKLYVNLYGKPKRTKARVSNALNQLTKGRLAQLAEHLVYTERVGGSSPSPPTSRRARASVAFALTLAALGLLTPFVASAENTMRFRVEPLATDRCGARCPHVIVADGVIEEDTPQTFVDFLKSMSDDRKLRRIVFFNSRGGNVVASMVFGHILRE